MCIANRVGHRTALEFLWRWRTEAWRSRTAIAANAARMSRVRQRATQAWRLRCGAWQAAQLLEWQQTAVLTERVRRMMSEAVDEWRRRSVVVAAMRGELSGSLAHSRTASIARALRTWREVSAQDMRSQWRFAQASIVGKYFDTSERLVARVGSFFAVWRTTCVDELPPVMRQLLRARRRMEAAQVAAEVEAQRQSFRESVERPTPGTRPNHGASGIAPPTDYLGMMLML